MRLVKPDPRYLDSYRSAIEENRLYRPDAPRLFSEPDQIVQRAYKMERGIDLPPGYVRATTLWLVDQDSFIGELSIRHELNEALSRFGGHIGYEVRCSQCGKGYGTKMLALALDYCKTELGLRRVLITCDDANGASAKVIERNGGVLQDRIVNRLDRGTVLTRRYWIAI